MKHTSNYATARRNDADLLSIFVSWNHFPQWKQMFIYFSFTDKKQ